ncbi:hypothetical protein ASG01_13685 [Chryseobacterium sp. Leaf180]|uniref:hypothetical protein n=1 Tax=Chryseobacterium sp. Leaf180 TaxID=1736289 RepID=UPI0006FCA607|nr:hypothetical protein [Chryseobacterium sp. Leaf180]KQR91421.1 hypothetical protein ASG01_13685 [Chryseobacterium sp. Leaf180]
MKKYISIFSVLTVLSLQSCEDENMETTLQNHELNKPTKVVHKKPNLSHGKNEKSDEEYENTSRETGDDDEPRRDKQHWRTVNDTVSGADSIR